MTLPRFYYNTIFILIGSVILFPMASTDQFDDLPLGFPSGIKTTRLNYTSWSQVIHQPNVLTAIPTTPEDILRIVNWASTSNYKVRAMGSCHNFSPLTVPYSPPGSSMSNTNVILLDMKKHFNQVQMLDTHFVRAGTGIMMETLAQLLELNNRTLSPSYTSTGSVTLGGAMAVAAHGSALWSQKEPKSSHLTWGSICQSVVNFTAIVSDNFNCTYQLKTFDRADPGFPSLLTHLGRAIIVSMVLETVPLTWYRLLSFTNISMSQLTTPVESEGIQSESPLSNFLEESGRVEIIWFPFTTVPWIKVWSFEPICPASSRHVEQPYNYFFADNATEDMSNVLKSVAMENGQLTPILGDLMMSTTISGLESGNCSDIWGTAKNTQFYVHESALFFEEFAWFVVTSKTNVVKNFEFIVDTYGAMMENYKSRGMFPMNGPVEIRCIGLDTGEQNGAEMNSPYLSSLTPFKACPQFDCAIAITLCTYPETPNSKTFAQQFEQNLFQKFPKTMGGNCQDVDGVLRPTGSKGFAVNEENGVWTDESVINEIIPSLFEEWDVAVRILKENDYCNVFTTNFTDRLLK